jgi:tetratricopeptide (TPR) repeat protein
MPIVGDAPRKVRKKKPRLHEVLRKRVRSGAVPSDDRKKATKLAQKGRLEYNMGLYDMAAQLFERAIELYPRYQRALYFLGNTYYKQNRVKEALAKWRACINVNPQDPLASTARRKIHHVAKVNRRLEDQLRELEEDASR